ncbi:MAG: putative addiction module antidote protein [Azoarcus sp.]|jgi:probable addiction module antidote protein|nr:putative addiction module antidote protein [Azoarcus sp.]
MKNDYLMNFDPADLLTSDEAIALFLSDAFESGDTACIAQSLGLIAHTRGIDEIARETGLSCERLDRAFTDGGNPTLKTTLAVMKALGLELVARPASA